MQLGLLLSKESEIREAFLSPLGHFLEHNTQLTGLRTVSSDFSRGLFPPALSQLVKILELFSLLHLLLHLFRPSASLRRG